MAAPNIVNVATITGKTALVNLSTTNATIVVSPVANAVLKIGGVLVANVHASSNADVDVYVVRTGTGAGTFYLAKVVTVPIKSSYEAVAKSGTSFYLTETDTLYVKASVGNALDVLVAYEEIS